MRGWIGRGWRGWWRTRMRRGTVRYDVVGGGAGDAISTSIATEVLKPRAGGLSLRGQQDADKVAVTSALESGSLPMQPEQYSTSFSPRLDPKPPQTRRSTPWRSPPSRTTPSPLISPARCKAPSPPPLLHSGSNRSNH